MKFVRKISDGTGPMVLFFLWKRFDFEQIFKDPVGCLGADGA
jgi:hypothetical protein